MILLLLLVGVAGDPASSAYRNLRGISGWRSVLVRTARAEGAKMQQQARHEDGRRSDI
jgi:hypothetical protein